MRTFFRQDTMAQTYRAFGLVIRSELSLPCLPSPPAEAWDLEINLGKVGEAGLENPADSGPFFQSAPGRLWLSIPGAGRFLVAGGSRIQIEPEAGAGEDALRLFVLGSCMGAILHQRGSLVLHGGALRFGDRAVIVAGDSGTGKSTTAAALHLRGHEILADDVAAIDHAGHVLPGYPQIKLWADSAKGLGLRTEGAARVRPQADKFLYPVDQGFCGTPLPLAGVCILAIHEGNNLAVEPARGMEKWSLLRRHIYRGEYVRGMGLQARQLELAARLANGIEVIKVGRPATGVSPDELSERLEAVFQTALAPG